MRQKGSIIAVLVLAASFAACPVPPSDWFDGPEPSPSFADDDAASGTPSEFPTPTLALCNPSPCDEPGGVQFAGSFTVIDEGLGLRSVEGSFLFTLWEYRNQTLGNVLCTQSWDFTADFFPLEDTMGCDATGGNCTSVCPYDDPSASPDPVGICSGHLAGIVGDVNSYLTDCNLINPVDWFHPESPFVALMEQFLLSFGVERDVASGLGAGASTWGEYSDLLTDPFFGIYPDMQGSHQVSFANGEVGAWTDSAFIMGLTITDRSNAPGVDAVGLHQLEIPFLLVFN